MKFIFLMLLLICSVNISFSKMRQAIMLDRYEYCKVPPTSPFKFGPIVLKNVNYKSLINSTFEVSKYIKSIKGVGNMTRCANKEQLDSCAYFTTLGLNNICPLLAQKGTIISPLVYSVTPPITCPFRPGHYIQVNGTIDPNLTQFFRMDKWYWIVSIDFSDAETDEPLFTLCIEGHIVSYYI